MAKKRKARLRLPIRIALYSLLLGGASLLFYQTVFARVFENKPLSASGTIAYAMNGEAQDSQISSQSPDASSKSDSTIDETADSSAKTDSESSDSASDLSESSAASLEDSAAESSSSEESESSENSSESTTDEGYPVYESGLAELSKTILLDAGHGGKDRGDAASDGTVEKTVALQMAQRIKKHLLAQNPNLNVLMVREGDEVENSSTDSGWEDLVWRRKVQDASNADYFISLHAHNSKNGETGYSFYLNPDDPIASALVANLQTNLQNQNWGETRAVITTDQYPLQLISNASSHSVMLDLGALNQESDLKRLSDEDSLDKAAAAIAAAISQTIQDNPWAPGYVSRASLNSQS